MNSTALAETGAGRLLLGGLAHLMESRLRYRFFSPAKTLEGAGMQQGQRVLEIGCGTGFFTLPAAGLVGDEGQLVAIDALRVSVDQVARRTEGAGLRNVRVLCANALDTGFDAGTFDLVLLFGVIPAPMLPLDDLVAEIHRLLCEDGGLAVWPWIPLWLPDAVVRSGRFAYVGRRNGVSRFVSRGAGRADDAGTRR